MAWNQAANCAVSRLSVSVCNPTTIRPTLGRLHWSSMKWTGCVSDRNLHNDGSAELAMHIGFFLQPHTHLPHFAHSTINLALYLIRDLIRTNLFSISKPSFSAEHSCKQWLFRVCIRPLFLT